MELIQLKIFRDIARERNFSKAARLNHLSQPAVSSRLKQLEEELGLRIFDRAPKKVRLTAHGELLLPLVEEILGRCDDLKAVVEEGKDVASGELRIASIPCVGIYGLSSFLKKFIPRYPKVQLNIQYRRSDIIYDLVSKGKIDLGLVAYPEAQSLIEITPYGCDELCLIVPTNHRLAGEKSIPLESIQGEPFVAFEDCCSTRSAIDKMLSEKNVAVSVQMSNDNVHALMMAVEAGVGVAIVPCTAASEEKSGKFLNCIRIEDANCCRPLAMLSLKGRRVSASAQAFRDLLLNTAANRCIC